MSETIPSQPGESDPLALLAGFSQSTRLLKLTTPLGADVLLAECVRGEEGIGTGFSFKIAALSTTRPVNSGTSGAA